MQELAVQLARDWWFISVDGTQAGEHTNRETYLHNVFNGYQVFQVEEDEFRNRAIPGSASLRIQLDVRDSRRSISSTRMVMNDPITSLRVECEQNLMSPTSDHHSSSPIVPDLNSAVESDDAKIPNTPSKIKSSSRKINFKDFEYFHTNSTGVHLTQNPKGQVLVAKKRRRLDTAPEIVFHAINKQDSVDEQGIIGQLKRGKNKKQVAEKSTLPPIASMKNSQDSESEPIPISKRRRPSQLGTTSTRSRKTTTALNSRFNALQLRGAHSQPLLIDSDEDMVSNSSEVDLILTPTSSISPMKNSQPHFQNFLRRQGNASQDETAEIVLPSVEPDDFMTRRMEVNTVLGPLAEARAEQWKGWKDDWKIRGVK